jgi:SAM-dependent methyltransferase
MSEARYGLKPERFSSHTRLLACLPRDGAGRRVLDLGGGEGYLGGEIARRGYRLAVVAAPGTVAAGLRSVADVYETDLDFVRPEISGEFDYVLCGDVLEHLRRPIDVLRWAVSCLASDGRVIASLPNGTHAYVRLHVLLGSFPKHDRGLFDRTHLHFFSWTGWRRLLQDAGLEIEQWWPTSIPVGLLAGHLRNRWPITWLEAANYGLAVVWKTMLAYQFVVVARKAPPAPLQGRSV